MKHIFQGKRIEGILTVLPYTEVCFKDEVKNYPFPEKQTLRLAEVMGYEKRRLCGPCDSVSEYASWGIAELVDEGLLDVSEVGAIVVVTTTPDYFTPPVSNLLHGRFHFSQEVLCMDINQACAGYMLGLMQSFLLSDILPDKKILLVAGDLLSKKVSVHDRSSRPLIGDAVTISVIGHTSSEEKSYFMMKNDGTQSMALNIPAGGFKRPSDIESAIERQDEYGNFRALDHLKMDGEAVFNFVVHEVPDMVGTVLEYSGETKEDIDFYIFHQPNKFILKKLADELDIPEKKMPYNIVERFGNSSSASIPVNICYNLAPDILNRGFKVCMAGFGAGLTWGSFVLQLAPMRFCKMINYEPVSE